jgi:aldehyde:ferredoxin oxidoreductase
MSEFGIVSAPIYPIWNDEEKKEFTEHETAEALRLSGTPEAADPEGYKGKAAMVHDMGMTIGLPDTVGTCKWHTKFLYMYVDAPMYARALSVGPGRTVEPEELIETSLRVRTLERALECKLGRRRENDTIPEKEFDKKVAHGYWKGKLGTSREGLERMKSEYYLIRGWDLETGIPHKETLLEYGLDDVAADMESLGILPQRTAAEHARAMKEPTLAHILLDEEEQRARQAGAAPAGRSPRAATPEEQKPAVASGAGKS